LFAHITIYFKQMTRFLQIPVHLSVVSTLQEVHNESHRPAQSTAKKSIYWKGRFWNWMTR